MSGWLGETVGLVLPKTFIVLRIFPARETSLFLESVEGGLTFNPGSGFSLHQKRGCGDGEYNITRNKIPPISLDIKMIVK